MYTFFSPKHKKYLAFFCLIIGFFLFLGNIVFAQSQQWELRYPWQEPAPSNIPQYIVWVFTFACTIAGVFAVLMIIIGGLQYMASKGNPQAIKEAKDRIKNAFWGLIVLACVYLLLNIINPELLALRLPTLPKIKTTTPAAPTTTPTPTPTGKYFPIQGYDKSKIPPSSSAAFGASRDSGSRHHAGVDLYANAGTPVYAVADGKVVNIYTFYEGSQALIVDHGDYVINYGEVIPTVSVGSKVKAGQVIANVANLSGQDMLHFELYSPGVTQNLQWYQAKPAQLQDPTNFLKSL